MTLDLFENHGQGEGGTELSEEAPSAPEPASDTAEAQPSLEEATTGGATGTIEGGATDGGSVEGGPASSDANNSGDAGE